MPYFDQTSAGDNEQYTADGWTWEENKLFEDILAEFDPPYSQDFFKRVELLMPWKSDENIRLHYKLLVDDVEDIDESENSETSMEEDDDDQEESPMYEHGQTSNSAASQPTWYNNQQRRRPIPWTAEEHRYIYPVSSCT